MMKIAAEKYQAKSKCHSAQPPGSRHPHTYTQMNRHEQSRPKLVHTEQNTIFEWRVQFTDLRFDAHYRIIAFLHSGHHRRRPGQRDETFEINLHTQCTEIEKVELFGCCHRFSLFTEVILATSCDTQYSNKTPSMVHDNAMHRKDTID